MHDDSHNNFASMGLIRTLKLKKVKDLAQGLSEVRKRATIKIQTQWILNSTAEKDAFAHEARRTASERKGE